MRIPVIRLISAFFILLIIACTVLNSPALAADRGISVASKGNIPTDNWGTYHALVIGINDYQKWPQLRTATKDAVVLSQVLVDRYGFAKSNVILRTDKSATRRQIIKDLRFLATRMKDNDNLLVYYAGHGQIDDLTGDGYWVPVEGEAKDPSTWVANSMVKSMFSSERVKAKNVIIIADSCYSGAMLRGGPSLLDIDSDYRDKLAKAASKRSRQVISSGGVEPVADGGADGHSLFAYYFLKALKENNREVMDLENLFHTRVWKPVTEIGDQRPNVGRLKTPMDDDGQFVLYNSGWVEEQKRIQAEQAAAAAATAKKKRQAEKADQMAAIQAERQKMELERQKLEMEKQLLAQQKELELQKLKLQKEKQELEYQKRTAKLEKMEASQKSGPAPVPKLAALNPKTVQPSLPQGKLSAALFPIKISTANPTWSGFALWDEACVAGLQKALRRDRRIQITHAPQTYDDLEQNAELMDVQFVEQISGDVWKKKSFFDAVPKPVPQVAAEYGRKLGVDVIILIYGYVDLTGFLEVYVLDTASGKMVSEKVPTQNAAPIKAAESAMQTALGKFQTTN